MIDIVFGLLLLAGGVSVILLLSAIQLSKRMVQGQRGLR